jgi:thioester reductase-like protein
MDGTILLTGATGFIGSRLARALAERGHRLALLVRPQSVGRMRARLATWPGALAQPRLVEGDLERPELGLEAGERARLRGELARVVHAGAVYHLGMGWDAARAANVLGTRNLLSLAREAPGLTGFLHVSTIAVSGDHCGPYRETDLDLGQGFFHAYGRSKFLAEQLVQASGLAWTVARPGVVVGDSRTGEFDKLDGPYYALRVLRALRRLPRAARMPMLVPREDIPFHLAPVDFVVAALAHLASADGFARRTFQLVDPAPTSFRRFYLGCLDAMGFAGPRIPRPVNRLVRLLAAPGVWSLSRAVGRAAGMPAELLPHLRLAVHYDCAGTLAALEGSGIACPPLLAYLPTLVARFLAAGEA